MQKQKSEVSKIVENDNFSYLNNTSSNTGSYTQPQAEDKIHMTQGEFVEHAGTKKEIYEFMQTQ